MDSPQDNDHESSELPEQVDSPEEVEEQHAPETIENPDARPHRPRADEALAAMRADLREEETQAQAGMRGVRGLFQRIFHRRRPAPPADVDAPSRLDALQFPEPAPASEITSKPTAEEATPSSEASLPESQPTGSKPDFQALVRDRLTEAWTASVQREPLEMQPPAPMEEEEERPAHSILTSLRQGTEETEEQPVDFRQAALEDYVVATDEPEEQGRAPLVRKLKTSWRYMRPTEKRLLIGALLIIALAIVAGSGYMAYQAIPTPTAVGTPTKPPHPIPISVSLPGGIVFPLSVGFVQDGAWNPKGAEWLSETEVCRWVSLPWNVQLEAVVRTFKANDEIQLSMSDYSSIVYKVQSIEEVPSGSINKLSLNTPSLLLILAKEDSEQRWVVTAKP